MAITLNLIETATIPPMFGVFRIGLANIIALVTIQVLGVKEMIIVNVMRVMIGNLMSGRIFGSSFWISFGGVLLSSIVLCIMHKLKASLMFTSVMSSIAHSIGQVCCILLYDRIYRSDTSVLPAVIDSNRIIYRIYCEDSFGKSKTFKEMKTRQLCLVLSC